MSLPDNVSTVTVTGTYLSAAGNPLSGHISFTPSVPVATPSGDPAVVVLARPAQVRLVEGAFTVELPATDDPGIEPSGFTYLVQEVVGSSGREYSIELPASTPEVDLADVSPVLPVTKVSQYARLGAENTFTESQTLESSFEGGENNFDSTSRLNLASHQRATNARPFGEVLRAVLEQPHAKAMVAWQENYTGHPDAPRTVAWIGAHGQANDGQSWHNHISIEVPDENGSMQTAVEVPFAQWDEPNGYGIAQPDRYVRTVCRLIAAGSEPFIIEGSAGNRREMHFSSGNRGDETGHRWSIRADNDPEDGGDAGSTFQIVRRSDDGTALDSPVEIHRTSGDVHIRRDLVVADPDNGPVLTDRTTGDQYRMYVDNGTLQIETVA